MFGPVVNDPTYFLYTIFEKYAFFAKVYHGGRPNTIHDGRSARAGRVRYVLGHAQRAQTPRQRHTAGPAEHTDAFESPGFSREDPSS